tara:strand:+ start:488 stop:1147 length:660 start_codon:yes stop_codon:yes gene_type:complete
MGVLIFTRDASLYREGHFVEGKGVVSSPSVEDLTVIVHEKRPSKEECLSWLPYVSYRMVFVCETAPSIEDHENVIFDKTMKVRKNQHITGIQAILKWQDRTRAWSIGKDIPMPLMLSFLRENDKNIDLWRLLSKGFRWTPEYYQMAAICYSCEKTVRPNYPKKKKKSNDIIPHGFRESDLYADIIATDDKLVGNHIRTVAKETLPKKAKKRKQKVIEWL